MTQSEHFAKAIAFARWPIFKIASFLEYLVFFGAVFCTEQLVCSCSNHFAKAIALHGLWPLQDGRVSKPCYFWKFGVFSSGFSHRTTLILLQNSFLASVWDPNCPFCKGYGLYMVTIPAESFFACFWHFKFLTQTDHFAKTIALTWAIAFARWPIFKIVSFLEYLAFFRSVSCTKQLKCSCRTVFRMFLIFLIFDPK